MSTLGRTPSGSAALPCLSGVSSVIFLHGQYEAQCTGYRQGQWSGGVVRLESTVSTSVRRTHTGGWGAVSGDSGVCCGWRQTADELRGGMSRGHRVRSIKEQIKLVGPVQAAFNSSVAIRPETSDLHTTPDLSHVVLVKFCSSFLLCFSLSSLIFTLRSPSIVLTSSLLPALKALFLAFRMALVSFVAHGLLFE